MKQNRLILASASPRRSELLLQLGLEFEVAPADIDESRRAGESAEAFVVRLAVDKARAIACMPGNERALVIGSDTEVVVKGEALGKPANADQAVAMLSRLSGREHQVMSAVALVADGGIDTRLSISQVRFRKLAPNEIEAYWATGEPAGKAGAYAVQGLAAVFIERLEGSYSGVMGLPLFETADLLEKAGLGVLGSGSPVR
jgi:septum formation protein